MTKLNDGTPTPSDIAANIVRAFSIRHFDAGNGKLEAESADELRFAIEAALLAERERCAAVVQLAREGEIDGDFRSLIHRIKNP